MMISNKYEESQPSRRTHSIRVCQEISEAQRRHGGRGAHLIGALVCATRTALGRDADTRGGGQTRQHARGHLEQHGLRGGRQYTMRADERGLMGASKQEGG